MLISEKFESIKDLTEGENSYQKAELFKSEQMIDFHTDSELSYNDIIGMSLGLNVASEFYDVSGVILTRNSAIIGVALGRNLTEACTKAFDCNPVDALNSTVTCTNKVTVEVARLFTENNLVVAPEFDKEAKDLLLKRSIKFVEIKTKFSEIKNFSNEEIKVTPFGILIQDRNCSELNKDTFKVVTKLKPTAEQIEDAVFAWKVAKYAKSNAIVLSKDFKTTSISQGISGSAIEYALDFACDTSKESVLASDLPLSLYDLKVAVQGRVSLLILPSANKEFIAEADKSNLVVITTGFNNLLG